ncbi:acyloxyacyl hydrolase [Hyphomonas sp.]|uniref:acyloxyacyl hydrolase n=1 Tax=Hyphomonas sp. TaxID=87 RepID=UPI0025BD72D8|nr:acyloxyacyl hydrolase [Hyphomonas sp.]
MRRLLALLALAAVPAATASAQLVEEVRVGLTQHNICVLDCDNAHKEQGPNVSGEIVFASPDVLDVIGSPRPYVMASVNLGGDTSFGSAGLHWNWDFADGWSFEPGIGYVIHDGELSFPFPQGDPRNDVISESKVFLGSRDLFRTSLALNRDLGDKWGAQLMFEHLSHGQILGKGRNQGIDNVGVRVIYRLGE